MGLKQVLLYLTNHPIIISEESSVLAPICLRQKKKPCMHSPDPVLPDAKF